MIIVHHLNASRSTRVVWLLEELGVPYEIVRHERDKATMLAPPELEKVHPLGKSPVVVDGDRVIAESGWILEYLVEKYGKDKGLVPAPDTQASDDCRYFMHYAEGSLMPQLLMKLVFTKVKTSPMPFFVKPIARRIADGVCQRVVDPNLKRHFQFLGAHLDKHAWIAGDAMTIADIQMSFPMIAAVARSAELGVPASMVAYAKKLEAVPGYQRAVAKAGA
jgi:glutathione S-transferase